MFIGFFFCGGSVFPVYFACEHDFSVRLAARPHRERGGECETRCSASILHVRPRAKSEILEGLVSARKVLVSPSLAKSTVSSYVSWEHSCFCEKQQAAVILHPKTLKETFPRTCIPAYYLHLEVAGKHETRVK